MFVTALVIATTLSLVASSSPDGLERVAADHGFLGHAVSIFEALIPGYAFPGINETVLATALAGFVGTVVVFAVLICIGWLALSGKPPHRTTGQPRT